MTALLEVRDLKTWFASDDGEFRAVDGVSFALEAGRTLGIVGESGCGKSVTALSIMGLVPQPPGRIAGGEILFEGVDLLQLSPDAMRELRGDAHRDDLPGADDVAQSGVHHRRPDRGRHPAPSRDEPRRGEGARAGDAAARAHPVAGTALSTTIRISCRAACASG